MSTIYSFENKTQMENIMSNFNSASIFTNVASVVGFATGFMGLMVGTEMGKSSNEEKAANLRGFANVLDTTADSIDRHIIVDDPISTKPRISGFSPMSIFSALTTEAPKFLPDELLESTAEALVRGSISFDSESDAPSITLYTQYGKHVMGSRDGEETSDVVIILNRPTFREDIDAKVLIAINSIIDVEHLDVSKHVLILGTKTVARKSNLANGFIASDNLNLGDCRMKNVQFCTTSPVTVNGQSVQVSEFDLGATQVAFNVFAVALADAILECEETKDKFGKPDKVLDYLKLLPIVNYGSVNTPRANNDTASENTDTDAVQQTSAATETKTIALTEQEWGDIGRMTNKKLSTIVAGFLGSEHTGETKKELIAQLKVLTVTVPSIITIIRKDLEHAEAVDDVVAAEAASADKVQDFLSGKTDTPFAEEATGTTEKN